MKTSDKFTRKTTFLIAGLAALSLAGAVAQPPRAVAGPGDDIVVPRVPANLVVPEGNRVYLQGHVGVGTQNYICMPCPNAITPAEKCPASGFAWAFFGPQATLFDVVKGDDDQIITHFNSTNPEEAKERPTWQSSRDTSVVWGNTTSPLTQSSTDAEFVAAGAIPWLRLPAAAAQVGPTGGDKLADTTFIQRLSTSGGVAPDARTCAVSTDAGKKALVPYGADYFFYKKAE